MLKKIGKALKKAGKAIAKAAKAVAKAIGGLLVGVLCIIPVIPLGGVVYEGYLAARNRGKQRRRLPDSIKQIMKKDFFPDLDLAKVRFITNASGVPRERDAITQKWRIYFKGSWDECRFSSVKLLLHELVHVKQYRDRGRWDFPCTYVGSWVYFGFSYKEISLEAAAISFEETNKDRLRKRLLEACGDEFRE